MLLLHYKTGIADVLKIIFVLESMHQTPKQVVLRNVEYFRKLLKNPSFDLIKKLVGKNKKIITPSLKPYMYAKTTFGFGVAARWR